MGRVSTEIPDLLIISDLATHWLVKITSFPSIFAIFVGIEYGGINCLLNLSNFERFLRINSRKVFVSERKAIVMAEYQPSFETLVRLAVERGVLLASLSQRYQLRYHLNDAHFSEHLHCTMDNLTHLKLCDLPRSDHFQEDIERIAEHMVNWVKLQPILRET
jgi:hypothetical protein